MRIRLHEAEAKGSDVKAAQINHDYRTCSNTTRNGEDDRIHIINHFKLGDSVLHNLYKKSRDCAEHRILYCVTAGNQELHLHAIVRYQWRG